MNDLELRLRRRIDELIDQRDKARAALAAARLEARKTRHALQSVRASREMWRHRAMQPHEERLAQRRRHAQLQAGSKETGHRSDPRLPIPSEREVPQA